MLIKFLIIKEEIINFNTAEGHRVYVISEYFINKNYIISAREDLHMIDLLLKNKLPTIFDKTQKFTRISINKGSFSEDVIAVGDVSLIIKKIEDNNG